MTEHAGFRSLLHRVDGPALHAVASEPRLPADAPAVVLVHGLGLSHRYMMPLARALAEHGCRVYVPDLPGFGDSGHPPEVLDVSGLAQALARWMEVAEVVRATPVGNSFGCQVAAALAAGWPERIDRVVLQGPTAAPRDRSTLLQFIRWRQNQRYNPPELDPVASADYRRTGYGRLWRTFRHGLADRIEDRMSRIRAPTLLVRGQCDPICRPPWIENLVERLPNGRALELPGVAHTLCYTAPAALAAVTRAFIDE